MEKNDIVILADGDFPSGAEALEALWGGERVVCCDGAAREFTARGGVPLAIVGDCDSLPPELLARHADIVYRDPNQQTNDLTKAVRWCMERGFSDITILGATGRREDHTLGNISLLADYAQLSIRMLTDHGVFTPILGDTLFDSFKGQQVSIFTLSHETHITTEGLRWPLADAPLTSWWQGTLNESLGEKFTIKTTGPAIIFTVF